MICRESVGIAAANAEVASCGGPRSVEFRPGAAQRLDSGAALLGREAPQLGAERRPGRPGARRPYRRGADERDEPFEGIVAVALLGTVALRRDHQHAVAGEPS